MKVLIADNFEQSGIEGLRAAGCEVIQQADLKDEALTRAIAETQAEVLVVRGTKVTEEMLNAGRLTLVVRAGAGYNTIDVAAASRRGIYVSNCPGKNAIAVAELTMALILALDRRVPDNVAELRAGRWNKKEYSKARGLQGQTLGLLGAGNIAAEVIRRAAAFGLDVVLWSRRFDGEDRPLSEEEARELGLAGGAARAALAVVLAPSPAEVAARCDILSVHLALKPETRGIVDAALLARLKPGAMVINTSRGEMVDAAGAGRRRPGEGSARGPRRLRRRAGHRHRRDRTTRSSACRASTGPTTSAPRPRRRRRRSPPRRSASSAPTWRRARCPTS